MVDPRDANFEHDLPVYKCEMCDFETEDEDTLMEHLYFKGEYD